MQLGDPLSSSSLSLSLSASLINTAGTAALLETWRTDSRPTGSDSAERLSACVHQRISYLVVGTYTCISPPGVLWRERANRSSWTGRGSSHCDHCTDHTHTHTANMLYATAVIDSH